MPSKSTARRPKQSSATKSALEALLKARDRVDEEMVTRRRTEEAALELFAAAEVEAQQVEDDADRQLAELERQRQGIADRRAAAMAAVDVQRGEALLLLAEQGRSAEQLAEMTSIPIKRVRAMIREARQARTGATTPTTGRGPAPHGDPAGSAAGEGGESTTTAEAASAAGPEALPTL